MPSPHPRRRRRPVALAATALLVAPLLTGTASSAAAPAEAPAGVPTVESRTFALDMLGAAAGRSTSAAERTVRLDVADGTQSAGLTWAGTQPATIDLRGIVDGAPTEWQHLDGDPAEGPDQAPRTGTSLAWFGAEGVDEVEVRLPAADTTALPSLELQAIRTEAPATAALPPATTSAADGLPTINLRSSWTTKGWVPTNPDCTPAPEEEVTGVRYAVVHHTDNQNGYAAADVPGMIAAIYAFHTGSNRWCDIGYSFIVDRFGRTWEGRSGGVTRAIVGSHAQGFNRGSVGVALLGDHQAGSPSSAALTAAGQLIGWKLALHRRDPSTKVTVTSGGGPKYREGTVVTLNGVVGHRDVGLTTCPGALLYSQLASIASTAKAYQATLPAPTAPIAPFRLAQDDVLQQYRDVLRRDPTTGPFAQWTSRLDARTATPGDLVSYLVTSQEADDLLHATTRLYRAYYGRNPDHSGFDYWVRRRATGTTLARISNSFAASSEFRTKYGSLTDAQFVDLVYANVLGRPADAGGRQYWIGRLAAGTARGVVMLQFSQSSEYVRTTREGTWVVASYEALLQRAVTESAYASLAADLRSGAKDEADVATSLLVSESYRKRIAPFT